MTRTVYVNGDYLPEDQATISIFDRGFLMADGVYEVVSVLNGKLLDFEGHLVRLKRSLSELAMDNPLQDDDYLTAFRALVEKNAITDGMIYLQVTRQPRGSRFRLSPRRHPAHGGDVHAIQAWPGQCARCQDRLEGHQRRRSAVGTSRHQDGAASAQPSGIDRPPP